MPHIHTNPGDHDLTVSGYLFREQETWDGGTELVMMLHNHKKMKKLIQPGGHVEINETPWRALQHELLEETGYEFDQVSVMQPDLMEVMKLTSPRYILHPYPVATHTHYATDEPHFHTDMSFLLFTKELPRNSPGEGEVQEHQWVTLNQLNALPDESVVSGTRDIGRVGFQLIKDQRWKPYPTDYFALDLPGK